MFCFGKGRPLPPVFLQVFIPKVVKVICFDRDSQVFILRGLGEGLSEAWWGAERACEAGRDTGASSLNCNITLVVTICQELNKRPGLKELVARSNQAIPVVMNITPFNNQSKLMLSTMLLKFQVLACTLFRPLPKHRRTK